MFLTPEEKDWIYYRLNEELALVNSETAAGIYDYLSSTTIDFSTADFIVDVFEDWLNEKGVIPDIPETYKPCFVFRHWWEQWDSEEEAEEQYRKLKEAGVPTEDIFAI